MDRTVFSATRPALLSTILFACLFSSIVLPIYLMDTNYAVSTFILFWFPVLVLGLINTRWLYRHNLIIPFIITNLFTDLIALYFEYAALGLGAWDFSEAHHKLLRTVFNNPGFPFALYDAPIEEFLFWFGAAPFCILVYITFERVLRRKERVVHELLLTAAWPIMLFPFVPFIWWLRRKLRGKQIISRMALALTILFFVTIMLFVEHNAILKGHWVYSNKRILGPLLFGTIPRI